MKGGYGRRGYLEEGKRKCRSACREGRKQVSRQRGKEGGREGRGDDRHTWSRREVLG